jgi:glycosyltransferase involved in cell wall biosynthesis
MKLSFVIPAHNEEALLGATLKAISAAAEAAGEPLELIVVDDASTDRTAEWAAAYGTKVVAVNFRKISAVRNAGARVATGDVLIFVDADTLVPPATLAAALQALKGGAIAGGAWVKLESGVPLWGRILASLVIGIYLRLGHAGGCFLFTRREAFESVGGFDESYYATEEMHLSKALKRLGPFVLVREPVITSGRKFRVFTPWAFIKLAARFFTGGGLRSLQRRDGLDMWYEAPRESAPITREPSHPPP